MGGEGEEKACQVAMQLGGSWPEDYITSSGSCDITLIQRPKCDKPPDHYVPGPSLERKGLGAVRLAMRQPGPIRPAPAQGVCLEGSQRVCEFPWPLS